MAAIKGDSITVYLGSTEITMQGDCEYSEDRDTLEYTNKDSSGYRDFLDGDAGWKITCSGFIDSVNWALLFGSTSGIKKSTVTGVSLGPINSLYYGGDGWLSSISTTAPRNGIGGFSFEITGTGHPFQQSVAIT
jgi:hypothetical protein